MNRTITHGIDVVQLSELTDEQLEWYRQTFIAQMEIYEKQYNEFQAKLLELDHRHDLASEAFSKVIDEITERQQADQAEEAIIDVIRRSRQERNFWLARSAIKTLRDYRLGVAKAKGQAS